MLNKTTISKPLIAATLMCAIFFGCSKKDSNPTPPSTDPCAGKTITITETIDASSACAENGKISVTASGSTGFTYKLNSSGTYQSSGVFENLKEGTYTIFVKDGGGCEKSKDVTVTSGGAAGPLFTAVKTLMTAKCQSCHNGTNTQGGKNWTVDCNIVANKTRIKVRAVDEGTMPPTGPLTAGEKDIITNWINAGGNYTD